MLKEILWHVVSFLAGGVGGALAWGKYKAKVAADLAKVATKV